MVRLRHVRRIREGREEVPPQRGARRGPLPRGQAAVRGREEATDQPHELAAEGLARIRLHEVEMEALPDEGVEDTREMVLARRDGARLPVPRDPHDVPTGLAAAVGGVVVPPGGAPLARLPDLDGRGRLRRQDIGKAPRLGVAAAGIGWQELSEMEGPDSQRIGQKPDGRQAFKRGRRGAQQPDKDP